MIDDNELIAAVIVTFNRLQLLKECISALKEQTRKVNEIIVINNSSSDGTQEWLERQDSITIILQENSGSSGGQYTGIKTAYEKGYHWIWCMDDDVKPNIDALQTMCEFMKDRKEEDIASLQLLKKSFPDDNHFYNGADFLEINSFKEKNIATNALRRGFILTNLFSFEGVLLNSSIIEKVGLPQKDYFCFYDDREYALRIKKILPQKAIVLIGKVGLQNIKYKINNNKLDKNDLIESEINIFCLYFRNLVITYRIHYPNLIKVRGVFNLILHYKKWIIKILIYIIFNKKRSILFKKIKNEIYFNGFKKSLNNFYGPIYYYKKTLTDK